MGRTGPTKKPEKLEEPEKPEDSAIYSILVFQLFLHGKVIIGETLVIHREY